MLTVRETQSDRAVRAQWLAGPEPPATELDGMTHTTTHTLTDVHDMVVVHRACRRQSCCRIAEGARRQLGRTSDVRGAWHPQQHGRQPRATV